MSQFTTKVVVVEDNEVNAKLLAYQLRHLGYPHVQVFYQAEAALRWLQQNPCDLVLTDCQMRPVDGFELTRRIRQHELVSQTYSFVIAVTADAMPHALQTCLDAGMDDYLVKPVQLNALQRMLNKWLHDKPLGKEA